MVGGVTLEVCCTDMGLYKVQGVVVDLYVDPLITWWVVNKGKGIRKLLLALQLSHFELLSLHDMPQRKV